MWFFLILISLLVFVVGLVMLIISLITRKNVKRSVIAIIVSFALFILGVFMVPKDDSNIKLDNNDNNLSNEVIVNTPSESEEKVFGLGEEIIYSENGVDLFSFKVNSVKVTSERNQFSDKKPAQVIVINYSYKNINSEDDVYIFSGHFTVVDEDGNVSETYPAGSSVYPQQTPKGAKSNGEESYGLIYESSTITFYLNPTIFGNEKIVFKLPVQ